MAQQPPVRVTPKPPTDRELEQAGEDARTLVAQSPILQSLLHGMIYSRQLYLLCRGALGAELTGGWTVTRQPLVEQTLAMSAENWVKKNGYDIATMIKECDENIRPMLAIIQEAQDDVNQEMQEADSDAGKPGTTDQG